MSRSLHFRFRHLVAAIALIAGCISATAWIINRPEVLHHALSLVNIRSDWRIDVQRFTWHPLKREIVIEGIDLEHREKGKRLQVERIDWHYRLMGLLKGKLVFDTFLLKDVRIALPPDTSARLKEHRRIDLTKLVLLKNVELDDGRIDGFRLAFGKGFVLNTDQMHFQMGSSLFGPNTLAFRTDGAILSREDKSILSAGALTVKASTEFSRWHAEFPYLNDLGGELRLADANLEGLSVEALEAHASYRDGKLELTELALTSGGRTLQGKLGADTQTQTFALNIDIRRPIALPHIGRPLQTIDTAGDLSGTIQLSGQGFIPSESSGRADVHVRHLFQAPPRAGVDLNADIAWKRGVFQIAQARVSSGDHFLSVDGTIDIPGKNLRLTATGKSFPIELVFNTFRNPYLSRIFGQTDVEGTFTGWGKKFEAHVKGTTYEGGWDPIVADRVETELTATYDDLKLTGTIFYDDAPSGGADLSIHFGPKVGDAVRSKRVDLDARIADVPLDDALAAYGLTGTGNGSITLKGPITAFAGEVGATIVDGSWHGLPFERVGATLELSRHNLTFRELALKLPGMPATQPESFVADLSPGKLRLHGTPLPGFTIDAAYLYAPKRWTIAELSWDDPDHPGQQLEAEGTLVSDGPINLKIDGQIGLNRLILVPMLARGGEGATTVDLRISGTTHDPKAFGSLTFNRNRLAIRPIRTILEDLSGTIRFEGSRIRFEEFTASSREGKLELTGTLDHHHLRPSAADLALTGKGMSVRSRDRLLRVEFDGNLALKGAFPSPLLSGSVNIIDGRYKRNFAILDSITGGTKPIAPTALTEEMAWFNPRLDLHLQTAGDFSIRNNIGDIYLSANVEAKGTRNEPRVSGSIETPYGKIHYLGLNFEVTKGFIEFREHYRKPYLEVHAEREIGTYNVSMTLYGQTDNLQLDLSATSPSGPLEKRDVVSLIMFGQTQQDKAASATSRAGGRMATSMAAQSLGGLLEQPITQFTHLDVFRLEAADPDSTAISRVYIGKHLSDRLTINFATDIGTQDAAQTVTAEYLITDNLLLKGSRSSNSKYELSGALRFQMR